MTSTVTTSLTTNEGTITHVGTAGFTVTGMRQGDEMDTLIEYSQAAPDELREMVCVLLCLLDDRRGEDFVASCLVRYAEETGKRFMAQGSERRIVIIRGAS